MEANNFKLFEIVNETIQDIYDFLIRYLRTFGLVLFKPKKFIEILGADDNYSKIVRPFNFVLFSLILLMLGIEVLNEPFYDIMLLTETDSDEKVRSTFITDLVKLNTTSLIMRFLPSIVFLILLSSIIEKSLKRIFKKEAEFGYIYLFGIGVSCFSFAIISVFTFCIYYLDKEFGENTIVDDPAILIMFFSFLSFVQIVFPAFLASRVLKFNSVHVVKRFFSFGILSALNVIVITAYLIIIISLTPTDDYYQDFEVLDTQTTESGLLFTVLYDGDDTFFFNQNRTGYIYTMGSWDEPNYDFYEFPEIKVITGKERNNLVQLEPNKLIDIEMSFSDPFVYQQFDSLITYTFQDYLLQFVMNDGSGEYREGKITFSY